MMRIFHSVRKLIAKHLWSRKEQVLKESDIHQFGEVDTG